MKHYTRLKRAIAVVAATFLIFIIPAAITPLAHSYNVNGVVTNCVGIDPALCPTQHENENWPVAIVDSIVKWLMYAVGLSSVILIIIGGLRYMLAAGNEQKVAGAKKMIIGALIGLGIAVLSLTIIGLVKYALGVA